MIEEIRISGLGVIDEATVKLGPGLTVVTGETGAGKTMVVTSIGLLLGARADAGLVRAAHSQAVVEGRVLVDPAGPVAARALDAGAVLEDGELLVARTISAEGRSRAHLGGRSTPVSVLTELADDLVAVHGQSDQQRLLKPARQRDMIDRYGGRPVAKALAAYRADHERLRALTRRLTALRDDSDALAREVDDLRAGLEAIGAVDPQPGEDDALAAESARLAHGDALRSAAELAHSALVGDDTSAADREYDVLALVGGARRALDAQREHDPVLDELAERLAGVGYAAGELAADLAAYATGVDTDPARLAAVEERRAELGALRRRFQVESIDEVLAWGAQAAERLAELDGPGHDLDALTVEVAQVRDRLAVAATALTKARRKAGSAFAALVTTELAALAMPKAAVEVTVDQHEDPEGLDLGDRRVSFGADGVDEVAILLRPHPGAEPRAIQKGASGGELSRVMLAVEVVLAGSDPVPTFVFDEVDAGVGGAAATEVGSRLARLARTAQVVVVTHLPQVAAFADRHLVVEKSDDGVVTSSDVVVLDRPARVRELARMLAGMAESELGQAHAEELLAAAESARARG